MLMVHTFYILFYYYLKTKICSNFLSFFIYNHFKLKITSVSFKRGVRNNFEITYKKT